MTPFAEDGRELISNPCRGKISTYTLYNQTETFQVPDHLSISWVDSTNLVTSDTKFPLIRTTLFCVSTFTKGMGHP